MTISPDESYRMHHAPRSTDTSVVRGAVHAGRVGSREESSVAGHPARTNDHHGR